MGKALLPPASAGFPGALGGGAKARKTGCRQGAMLDRREK
jgi:hypothetical protein